jgi:transaldolase
MSKVLDNLKVKIFADGADLDGISALAAKPWIKGITTNPTLMRRAGITDYAAFAKSLLDRVKDKPISFEVFSDEFGEMERQALEIRSWGENVYVKLPVTNTKAEFSGPLISRLSKKGVKVNVTAILPLEDVKRVCDSLRGGAPACVSVFAGRIADAGVDPLPIMKASVELAATVPGCEVIWASPRELLNVVQADAIGCHIITVTEDILKKLSTLGKDLAEFSLDTVKMFRNDALACGFKL